jgi:uncharacterized metal-binding protein YceD (DUF177 family)
VQGQLREGPLVVVVETECAHCAQPLHIEIDGELTYRVVEEGAEPRVFVPLVDFEELADPNIIDAF